MRQVVHQVPPCREVGDVAVSNELGGTNAGQDNISLRRGGGEEGSHRSGNAPTYYLEHPCMLDVDKYVHEGRLVALDNMIDDE
ncbi:unnamed protein product [Sphenostylis stenocarpa]|uniref:Uncharacterized protein n=1 Tax=Sphenostylis stenocarpa TaxID=92480 RepID=A0AA86VIP1_9FABA|nr:unnamed protein product [Sphenostylis stenocarpa]